MSKGLELAFLKAATADKRGDLTEAERLYRAILVHYPANSRAKAKLVALASRAPLTAADAETQTKFDDAMKLQLAGKHAEAEQICREILEIESDHAGANHFIGSVLLNSKQAQASIPYLERAAKARPDMAAIHNNLGFALQSEGRSEEALVAYRRALALRQDYAGALSNLGNLYQEQRRLDDALDTYEKALAIEPDFVDANYNKALLSLTRGNFEIGWQLYEWRKLKPRDDSPPRKIDLPQWTGAEKITGKALFIHAEQGLGDTIQFIRYAELVQEQGSEVTVSVQTPLVPILSAAYPKLSIVAANAVPHDFDFQVPLMSLPLAFGTRVSTVPSRVPYIRAEAARVRRWTERLGEEGFKIGICWQGSMGTIDRGRSFALTNFAGIAALPGVRLISLHKGVGEAQLAELPDDVEVETLGEDFDSPGSAFLDSAAVIESCDLVITSDTSIAHLAGAMGRPVWVLLKEFPDWRWMLEGDKSPWYPTMRLFRQPAAGDWASVFAQVKTALIPLVEARA